MSEFYDEDTIYKEEDLNTEESTEETVSEDLSKKLDLPEDIENESALAKKSTLDLGDIELEVEDDENDNVSQSDILTPEERLRMFGDKVLSCCVGDKEIVPYALNKLLSVTNPRLFRDENYVLFSVLFAYRGKLKQLSIDDEFIKLYLNRNRKILQKARGYIDLNAYGEIDGSVELGYISGVVKHFKRLCSMGELSTKEFETMFEKYLIEFKTIEATRIYNQSSIILTDGMDLGRKHLMGFEDSYNFSRKQLAEIEGLVDFQRGSGFTKDREMILEEKIDGKKSYKISDFDRLEALNDVYGGIYTGMFYQFLAPPKSGKTKLCARIAHTTKVKYGNNVTIWAQEGGKEAFLAQLRAIHFDYTYNTNVDISEKKFGISQDVILKDKFPTEDLRQLEMSSKLDFASNTDYGVIDFIDRPFEVETFLDDIDASIKENNSTLLIIDYLQIIQSAGNKSERERVSDAYISLLNYCKDNNIAVITPGQYKQEAFNALLAKGTTADADMRTSGGTSAEVLRTPDVILALWATTTDLLNNKMKFLSMPSRMNVTFPEIKANIDLCTCQFISVKN